MADMASPTDASAGSKIFVGGLDRSVDEGASTLCATSEAWTSHFRFHRIKSKRFDYEFRALLAPTGVVRNFFQQFGPVVEVRKTSPFDSRIFLSTPSPAIRTSETVLRSLSFAGTRHA